MNGKGSIILPIAILLVLLSCGIGYAQSTGAIVGTVKETTGAVIPGAVVKITNQGTGITREIASDDNGRYVAESLPVGVYDITTEVAGFKRFAHKEINLNVADRLNIDIVMEVGQVSEVVTVQGGPVVGPTNGWRAGTSSVPARSRTQTCGTRNRTAPSATRCWSRSTVMRAIVTPRAGQVPAWTWAGGNPEGFVWRQVHASQLGLHWAERGSDAQQFHGVVS